MADIQKLIENPHPVYKRNVGFWNFLLQSYEGGIDYANVDLSANNNSGIKVYANGKEIKRSSSSNLFQHPKERDEDYQKRLRRSYYYNYCAPIIDIYTNHLFKQPVNQDFDDLQRFIDLRMNDLDLMGSNLTEMRKQIAETSQIYGHCFVIIDNPNVDDEIVSLQQRIDGGIFPYLAIYHPQQIINWSLDAFGRPYWVLIMEEEDSNSDVESFTAGKSNRKYKLWTRKDWSIYDGDFNLIDTDTHNLNEVPIVCVFNKQSKKQRNFLGISEISDIAFINRDVFNLCSELNQILIDQTFGILALQGKSTDFSAEEVGTNKALIYPEGVNAPQYVSPPPANAEVYMKRIDAQIEKMYQLAKLESGSASFQGQSAVQKSGVSKAWDFNQTNSALSKKASNLEDAEQKIWKIYANWENINWNGYISYPNEFSIQSLNDDIEQAFSLMRLKLGKTFDENIKKTIIKKKFPRMPEEDIEVMEGEVESIPSNGSFESTKLVDRLLNNNVNRNGKSGSN